MDIPLLQRAAGNSLRKICNITYLSNFDFATALSNQLSKYFRSVDSKTVEMYCYRGVPVKYLSKYFPEFIDAINGAMEDCINDETILHPKVVARRWEEHKEVLLEELADLNQKIIVLISQRYDRK